MLDARCRLGSGLFFGSHCGGSSSDGVAGNHLGCEGRIVKRGEAYHSKIGADVVRRLCIPVE